MPGTYISPAETGFYYVVSRYYDAEISRFISVDTTDILDVEEHLYDKNPYAYCDNNPIMRKDENGAIWIAAVVVGVATQYVGDIIGNVIDGKTGGAIFKPTSSVGEYIAAGTTALIPGSGLASALVRNVVAEGIVSVERYVTGQGNSWETSVENVLIGTVVDNGMESVSNRISKSVKKKTAKTYSQYAKKKYKKNSKVSAKTIRENARRSVRWGNRLSKGIDFAMSSLRNALPW